MRRAARDTLVELAALVAPLASALADLLIRYRYHLAAGETVRTGSVVLALCAAPILVVLCHRRAGDVSCAFHRSAQFALSLGHALALLLWVQVVLIPGAVGLDWWFGLSRGSQWLVSAALILVVWLSASRERGRRFHVATGVATLLFVTSQTILAHVEAVDRWWPQAAPSSRTGTAVQSHGATIFILLDETNDMASGELIQALSAPTLNVSHKSLDAIADGTAKAVPQMFSELDFHNARPCSFSAICSDQHVLDFARITASRPDVDVVGFFHPYCDMKGLRYCRRFGVPMPLMDVRSWRCAIERRMELRSEGDRCSDRAMQDWSRQKTELLEAFWAAPVWTEGGFLFAHLPLPHPPATPSTGNLAKDYRRNIAEAAALLKQVTKRLSSFNGRTAVVVFSDHPLRPDMWCQDRRYENSHCVSDSAALRDSHVPLLVATSTASALDLSRIRNNAEVFRLAEQFDQLVGPLDTR